MTHPPQRRNFSRIQFQGRARLSVDDQELDCEVVDLSLHGALVAVAAQAALQPGQRCLLEIKLDDGATVVRMEGDIVHREHGRIGLVCREIDLDSMTHLRRLLALNLGDAELLHREFSALLAD